jgi:hypothetical protein
MSSLKSEEVVELVTKAFVLEAVTDKPGCTTRYEDLPGKPLQDFIVAGINSAKFYGYLAKDIESKSDISIFDHNLEALKVSNKHKSGKYINIGLLEIMFLVVAARLHTDNIDNVIDECLHLAKKTTNVDVSHIISTRKLAWSTSGKTRKSKHDFSEYENCQSILKYFELRCKNHAPDTSFYQWSKQYLDGLPILSKFLIGYKNSNEIMETTKKVFQEIMTDNPGIRVGIVADFCAAAIFIWLSFKDSPV